MAVAEGRRYVAAFSILVQIVGSATRYAMGLVKVPKDQMTASGPLQSLSTPPLYTLRLILSNQDAVAVEN